MRVELSSPTSSIFAGVPRDGYVGQLYIGEDGIEGWYSMPAPQQAGEALPLPGGASWPVSLTPSARVVTLHLVAVAESSVALQEVLASIGALCYQPLTLTVIDASGPKSAECYMSDEASVSLQPQETAALVDVILTCPDPLRYGPEQTVSGSGGAFSAYVGGNAPTWPVFTFGGNVTAVTLSSGGSTVSWSGTGPVTIDMSDVSASTGSISSDDGFAIGPGNSYVSYQATGATSSSMAFRPAWR